jgi:hypothetical protein
VVVRDDPSVERRSEVRLENRGVHRLVQLDELTDGTDRLLLPPTLLVDDVLDPLRQRTEGEDGLILGPADAVEAVLSFSFSLTSVVDFRLDRFVLLGTLAILPPALLGRTTDLGEADGKLAHLVVGLLDLLSKRATFGLDVAGKLAFLLSDGRVDDADFLLHAREGGVEVTFLILCSGRRMLDHGRGKEKGRKRARKKRTFQRLIRSFSALRMSFSSLRRGCHFSELR